MKKKINFPLVVILIILLGALLLVVAFQYDFSFQKEEQQNQEQEEIDTSGWKTYRNEEHGFEFRYPLNCLADNIKDPSLTSYASSDFKGVERVYVLEVDNCNIRIEIYTNPSNLSLDEWLDHYTSNISPVGVNLAPKISILLSKTKGYRGLFGCCMNYPKGIILIKGNKVYTITGQKSVHENQEEKDLWLSENWNSEDDIYNQILSTFRFVD